MITQRQRQRFLGKISFDEKRAPCWPWTGTIANGYGRIVLGGRRCQAHRIAYEIWVGPIPEDKQIDHRCRNRACVRPDHLRAVTSKENTHAPGSLALAKTHAEASQCPKGHAYTPENTRLSKRGFRNCRECHRQRTLAVWRRKSQDPEFKRKHAARERARYRRTHAL